MAVYFWGQEVESSFDGIDPTKSGKGLGGRSRGLFQAGQQKAPGEGGEQDTGPEGVSKENALAAGAALVEQWKTHSEPTVGYHLMVPESWVVEVPQGEMMTEHHRIVAKRDNAEQVRLFITDPPFATDLDGLVDFYAAGGAGFFSAEPEKIQMGSAEARLLQFDAASPTSAMAFTQRDNRVITLAFGRGAVEFARLRTVVLRRFRFEGDPPPDMRLGPAESSEAPAAEQIDVMLKVEVPPAPLPDAPASDEEDAE